MKRQLRSLRSKPGTRDEASSEVRSPPNGALSKRKPATTEPKVHDTAVRASTVEDYGDSQTEAGHDMERNPKSCRVGAAGEDPAVPKCAQEQEDPPSGAQPGAGTLASTDRTSAVLGIEREMCAQLPRATFVGGKVTHVYNPLEHAAVPHAAYVGRCLGHGGGVPFLLVGMNPGPWGMSQTGVPFGEVAAVRDWMGVSGQVATPVDQNPHRPVTGFSCERNEVSGRRLWGLLSRLSGSPDRLFRHAFVHNFCPLAFMERSGKNVTPNCLGRPLRDLLEPVCRRALIEVIQVLGVHTVVGVGKYAEDQARRALAAAGMAERVRVYPLLHPSPINPQANKDWDSVAVRQLTEAGLLPLCDPQVTPPSSGHST